MGVSAPGEYIVGRSSGVAAQNCGIDSAGVGSKSSEAIVSSSAMALIRSAGAEIRGARRRRGR